MAADTGLVVTLPLGVGAHRVAPFLRRHERWILRHIDRLDQLAEHIPRRWPYGDTLPYRGQEHLVHIEQGPRAAVSRWSPPGKSVAPLSSSFDSLRSLRTIPRRGGGDIPSKAPPAKAGACVEGSEDGRLVVTMRRPSIDGARRRLKRWYHDEAERALLACATARGEELGLVFRALRVRDQRRRWGSCSAHGRLSFNYRLIMAPPDVLDYVVVHELLHLREPNHSRRFWILLAQRVPSYQDARAWLTRFGPYLGV